MLALIFGSIPIIFSCFSQSLLNWHGPFETFYGLIIWYQRPLDGITGITGLFSNPNYLGAWLNIIWPFCLALLYFDNRNISKVILKTLLSISISILIILTASRGAWICLLISLPLIYGSVIKKWFIIFCTSLLIIVLNLSFPIFGNGFQNLLRVLVPEGIWINFTSAGFESLDISRVGIWKNAFTFILDKPIFGHGSNSFPGLFMDETGFWKAHPHNILLELGFNFGIPTALILLIPISYIIYKSCLIVFIRIKKINKETIIDRAWVISLLILTLANLLDIQYFDGRISIMTWILLAGSKNIIMENSNKEYKKNAN